MTIARNLGILHTNTKLNHFCMQKPTYIIFLYIELNFLAMYAQIESLTLVRNTLLKTWFIYKNRET
jgi:hypothetical protein